MIGLFHYTTSRSIVAVSTNNYNSRILYGLYFEENCLPNEEEGAGAAFFGVSFNDKKLRGASTDDVGTLAFDILFSFAMLILSRFRDTVILHL